VVGAAFGLQPQPVPRHLRAGQRDAAERAVVQAYLVYGRLGDRVGEARAKSLAQGLAGRPKAA